MLIKIIIIIVQRRAREVVDYRISKSIEQKQIEDSIYISSKLEQHNKVNIQIIRFNVLPLPIEIEFYQFT